MPSLCLLNHSKIKQARILARIQAQIEEQARRIDEVARHLRGNIARATNVHQGDRDQRTKAAVENLMQTYQNLGITLLDADIQTNLKSMETFVRAYPDAVIRGKAVSVLEAGPVSRVFGHLLGDSSIFKGLMPVKKGAAYLWHFCTTYNTEIGYQALSNQERDVNAHLKDNFVRALADSVDEYNQAVCNDGKIQRLAVAVLQGYLPGVDIDGLLSEENRIRLAFEGLKMEFSEWIRELQADHLTAREEYIERAKTHVQNRYRAMMKNPDFERFNQVFLEQVSQYLTAERIPSYQDRDNWVARLVNQLATVNEGAHDILSLRRSTEALLKQVDFIPEGINKDDFTETLHKVIGHDGKAHILVNRILMAKQDLAREKAQRIDAQKDAERVAAQEAAEKETKEKANIVIAAASSVETEGTPASREELRQRRLEHFSKNANSGLKV